MTNKHCLVYETLGKVSNLTVMEAKGDGLMRLEGIFGVCGIKNQNNRVYDKENYRQMVESLQKTIKESGCPGELEHPNSMNINLENVSHKIEDIQMNEDGTITGTIVLLNTPKGQIAQAIVEGGLPLYISSRGAGTITNEGRVTLSTIKTYDLVGTPGFSQAQLKLKSNQTLECLNESLDDGNVMYAIVEGEDDDLLGGDPEEDKKEDEKEKDKPEKSKEDDKDKEEKSSSKEDQKEEKPKKEDKKDNKNTNKVDMEDLKKSIDELKDQVTSLEAELHIAKESLNDIEPTNYEAIEKWITNEFGPRFKDAVLTECYNQQIDMDSIEEIIESKINESVETIANGVQNWVCEEFAPEVQNWVCEEFAPEVQNWVCEEFAPEVQNWVCEEFAPEVQNWVCEEFAPEVQNWVCEEFAPEVQNWVCEEFAPVIDNWVCEEFAPEQMNKINENVSAFMESQKAGRLEEIDSLLESISDNSNKDLETIVKENANDMKYKGVYVVENMPAELQPSWEMLSEARQKEIIRSSRMYDFTKEGVLESFWSNVNFDKSDVTPINENVSPVSDYHSRIVNQMRHLRNSNF